MFESFFSLDLMDAYLPIVSCILNRILCIAKILEGKAYRLKFPWVGVVNRSQADINKNVDMIAARRREREYFASTPEYKHLAHRMGSEHLAKVLSKVCLPFILSNPFFSPFRIV